MNRQKTFANASTAFEKYKKSTKREKFLAEMKRVVPWKELYSPIEPFYLKPGKGRPPIGLERMLRIHFLQSWFNLSDPGAEETLYDMESMRRFVGIDLGNEPVPDETTICKFRHLLEARGLGERYHHGRHHHQRSFLHEEPGKKRDPDTHSTKKGNQYYFGMKIHVGVDRENRTVHSLVTTPANVHDSKMVEDLLHGEENVVFCDSAYMGKTEEITKKHPGRWT